MPVRAFADKVKEEPDTIKEWERCGAELSTSKMDLISSTISCHWSVLLRDDPLPIVERPKSKRVANGHRHTEPETVTLVAYREAHRLLDNIYLSDLAKINKTVKDIIKMPKDTDPEIIASHFRTVVGFDTAKRRSLSNHRAVYTYLVGELEKIGIFVSEQEFNTDDIKGFLISKDDTYLIAISSLDKFPASRLFTLLHETGHILIGGHSSACDFRDMNGDLSKADTEERFCDSFAAAVLMPKTEFENDKHAIAMKSKLDNDTLNKLATSYRTSYLAVVRRLYTLDMISYTNYTKKTKEFFDDILPKIIAVMRKPKKEGFVLPRSYYVNQEIRKAGKSFTDFVINKYGTGNIGSGEAKRLLGVDTRYLVEIEKMVGAGR